MKFSRIFLRSEPPLALSVSVSDVQDAFYDDWATFDTGRYWWWIQMLLLEPNELIVNNGENDLYRMAFTIADNGLGNEPTITFGDLTPVRLEPVDSAVDDDAVAAAVKGEAVLAACAGIASVRGREKVAASFKSREESRPKAKKEDEQVREHLKKLRAKLGAGDDVSDEKVLELAAERLDSAPGEVEPGKVEKEGTEPKEPEPKKENEPAPTAPEPEEVEPGANVTTELKTVTLAADTLAELQAGAAEGREARRLQLAAEDETFVQDCILDGRIPPRSKNNYLAQMKRDREGTREFLSSLDENVVPVSMRGTAEQVEGEGAPVNGAHPQMGAYMASQFPDVVERKERILALNAAGSRIHTDA